MSQVSHQIGLTIQISNTRRYNCTEFYLQVNGWINQGVDGTLAEGHGEPGIMLAHIVSNNNCASDLQLNGLTSDKTLCAGMYSDFNRRSQLGP